ncbi:cyd operon YbgE family protein [Pseudomonas brassicacearum]|uniref:cyd operon YbgE family protein n=1 Tax=Pseudomonas brassicacearum TaxID=930166 RepID=UPI0005701390|nr:cyd operon YbgE family protein [Pseudomonas brassicacearum]
MAQGSEVQPSSSIHGLSLSVAVTIMLAGTLYPPMMVTPDGSVDHGLAGALFAAMSVAFVRGVGFVPRAIAWRWLFSGWAGLGTLVLAAGLKYLH